MIGLSKIFECEPRRWKIIEHVREKFSCRDCEAITEPPAPSHPIPHGFAVLIERTRYARAVAGLLAASHLESFDNGVSKALILGFDGSAM